MADDTPMETKPEGEVPAEGEEDEEILSGSEGEEVSEDEEMGDGDSDDECEDFDESKPPEDQLLHYSFNAIKMQPCNPLGDFGAAEVFLIDGDALVAKALCDRLLDTTCGGQMLHLVHTVESILQALKLRGAHFELFFFEGNNALWQRMGARQRSGRAVVLRHLQLVNKQRELQGQPPVVTLHILPGGWWSGGPEFQAMMDTVGPAYMITDFGWCGAEDKTVLSITRSFVHFAHANFIQVVTLADLSIEGSRVLSCNMQPARKPTTRQKFAQAMAKLVADNKAVLDSSPASTAGAVGEGEAVDVTFVAALKKVTSDKVGGDKSADLAACLSLAMALSKRVPLTERAFVIPPDALDAWKSGAAGWAAAAEAFMEGMNLEVASVLEDADNAAALTAGLGKESCLRLADLIDGRLFVVVLARCLSGGFKLAPEVSAAAQKLFVGACAGDSRVAGKKPAGASGEDEKASDVLVKAIQAAAQERRERRKGQKQLLLPMEGKDLLQTVQGDLHKKMEAYEDKAWDHSKHVLGKYREADARARRLNAALQDSRYVKVHTDDEGAGVRRAEEGRCSRTTIGNCIARRCPPAAARAQAYICWSIADVLRQHVSRQPWA